MPEFNISFSTIFSEVFRYSEYFCFYMMFLAVVFAIFRPGENYLNPFLILMNVAQLLLEVFIYSRRDAAYSNDVLAHIVIVSVGLCIVVRCVIIGNVFKAFFSNKFQ